MRLNPLLAVFAGMATVTCASFLLFPAFSIERLGGEPSAPAEVLLRLAGALFGGLAVMAWTGRNAAPSDAREAMVSGLAALNALAAVVAVGGARSGLYGATAWVPVVAFTLFAMAFASVRFGDRFRHAPSS